MQALCQPFPRFLAFVKSKFVSHILVPYESIGFVERHLAVDGFGFAGIRVSGREVLKSFDFFDGKS